MVEAYIEGRKIPFTAGAAITAGQVVELTADETVAPTAGASSKVIGVALMDAAANEKVTVVTEGVVEVVASGAINAGDKVKSAANGQVAAVTLGTDPDYQIIGVALTSAAAAGDKIKIKLTL